MATEDDAGEAELAESIHGGAESGLILGGAVVGRSVRTKLAEGQVAAEDGEAGLAESFGEGDEERALAVGSGAVGEDKAGPRVGAGGLGAMEETADGRIGSGVVKSGDDC
jgi:hypothetical protein